LRNGVEIRRETALVDPRPGRSTTTTEHPTGTDARTWARRNRDVVWSGVAVLATFVVMIVASIVVNSARGAAVHGTVAPPAQATPAAAQVTATAPPTSARSIATPTTSATPRTTTPTVAATVPNEVKKTTKAAREAEKAAKEGGKAAGKAGRTAKKAVCRHTIFC
jgi:hypothetical protein